MRVIQFGASGATGQLVTDQLIERGMKVRLVVRDQNRLSAHIRTHEDVEIIEASIDEVSTDRFTPLLADCQVVICTLGHNLTFKGLFGPPHKLVTHQVQKILLAASKEREQRKLILMSTTAYTNRRSGERDGIREAIVRGLLRLLLPPHRDNMLAADTLVRRENPPERVEWVAVRPDSLIDEQEVSPYQVVEHFTRSPVFDAGKTSRINVAHFMASLLEDEELWERWKSKTPVIYND